jgi:hypothetical protein
MSTNKWSIQWAWQLIAWGDIPLTPRTISCHHWLLNYKPPGGHKCASHVDMIALGTQWQIYDTKLGTDKCDNSSMLLKIGYTLCQSELPGSWPELADIQPQILSPRSSYGVHVVLWTAQAQGKHWCKLPNISRSPANEEAGYLSPYIIVLSGFLLLCVFFLFYFFLF